MTTTTITFRVDAAEHAEIAARAERDKISLSDYVRVRLGLRGDGPAGTDDSTGPPWWAWTAIALSVGAAVLVVRRRTHP